jgi:hypothetical protein
MGNWIKIDKSSCKSGYGTLLNLDRVNRISIEENDDGRCWLSADGFCIAEGTRDKMQSRLEDLQRRLGS